MTSSAVEQGILNPYVEGSIPSSPSTKRIWYSDGATNYDHYVSNLLILIEQEFDRWSSKTDCFFRGLALIIERGILLPPKLPTHG